MYKKVTLLAKRVIEQNIDLKWSSYQPAITGLCGKVLVARRGRQGYRGGLCEKLPETSPMSNRDNARQLQDQPTAGQIEAINSSSGITYLRREKKWGRNSS